MPIDMFRNGMYHRLTARYFAAGVGGAGLAAVAADLRFRPGPLAIHFSVNQCS